MALSISSAFKMYCYDYIAMRGLSHKTEEAYVSASKELIRRFGDVDICSLTFADIRDWKVWLDKGRQEGTVRGYIVCLRVVLKYLTLRGFEVVNPESIPVPKRVNKIIKYMLEEEVDDFIAEAARPIRGYHKINRMRNVAIIELLYATGLRNAELCSLNRDSIKNNTFSVVGKGSKPRIGFVSDRAMKAVEVYLKLRNDANPALFVSYQNGKRITPNNVQNIFRQICARSDFENIHPHTIRHSYATKLLKKEVDIRFVQELMGHTDLNTTAHYTHLVNQDLKKVYEKAHTKA